MKKVFRIIFFFFIGLYLVIHFFDSIESPAEAPTEFETDDFDKVDTLEQEIMVTHNRVWKDADDSKRALQYQVSSLTEFSSFYYRDTVNVAEDGTEKTFWHNFYFGLYNHDKNQLAPLQDSLKALAATQNIPKHELAYTIVSFVQDIPYHYILSDDSCSTHTDFPCVPSQRYGVLSPIEFLYSLSGDCDTRTVLLFTLLKNMGYSPVIVNSAQYGHSMLAIDIPTEGDFFEHKGRKFYFWETTATGWMPGMLPPEMSNKDYWTIILDHEYEADPTRSY